MKGPVFRIPIFLLRAPCRSHCDADAVVPTVTLRSAGKPSRWWHRVRGANGNTIRENAGQCEWETPDSSPDPPVEVDAQIHPRRCNHVFTTCVSVTYASRVSASIGQYP